MKEDLKTKLFANVLLGAKKELPVFNFPRRSAVSLEGIIAVTLAALSVAGLMFLVFEKIKPLF